MNFCSYRQTPGLERYPGCEAFKVWRGVHKQLMRDDADYRRRCNRFTSTIAGFTVVSMMMICLPQTAVWIVSGVLVTIVGTVFIVLLSFRQQAFMNQRIGDVLQRQ